MNNVPLNWHHTAENIAITEHNFHSSQFSQQVKLLRLKIVQWENTLFSLSKTTMLTRKNILAAYMTMQGRESSDKL